ncbi:MAG: exodeoxyribonuclease VII small subunit [Clostridia bacterium]|nr:exodeoxyribonuclease VII small subunit [Clostridia bacterium]
MTYEQAYAKLEEISLKLSSGEIGLEEATKLFEQAIELSKICYEKLKQTEGQLLVFKGELEKLKPLTEV